jgi:hypothetical protein
MGEAGRKTNPSSFNLLAFKNRAESSWERAAAVVTGNDASQSLNSLLA